MKLVVFLLSCFFSTPLFALDSVPLFPNDSLDGWYIVGPQITFSVEDGVLTGEGKEQRNAFLTSDRSYSDFYLKVDVKIIRGNSGIQIRSHDVENRLVGYQIEADPSERAWSGGLYDEDDERGFNLRMKMFEIHLKLASGTHMKFGVLVHASKQK